MSSWQSHTHVVGSRTFQVLEHTTDQVVVNGIMTGTSQQWRTVQDGTTGEIVREFRPPPNTYGLGSYDFDAGHRWLQERYGEKPHGFAPVPHIPKVGEVPEAVAYIQNWSGSGNWTIKSNHIHAHPTNAVATTPSDIVPADAKHFEACTYGGYCDYCEVRIERGSPIWWTARLPDVTKGHIWCGKHKTNPAATAVGEEHNTEDDMAQRKDFTFPYLGSEIAASLERKAAKLDAQIEGAVKIDRSTAALLGYPTDSDYEGLVREKQKQADRNNKKLSDEAASLRKEAIPYAKASKLSFEIDLEDIEFFGLNDDDAPAPTQKRKRRTKAEMEADAAVSAA